MSEMENVESIFALSPIQEGMLFHSISDPQSGVFVTQIGVEITGLLDPLALRGAWERATARHPALRTAFFWDGLDAPLQLIRRNVLLPWEEYDWTGQDTVSAMSEFLAHDRTTPFDLTDAPAMRLFLIRIADAKWRMVWSFHHIMIDGWSANLVLRDVLSTLGGAPESPVSPSYEPFVYRALEVPREAAARFWRARLANRNPPTRVADLTVHPVQGHGHHRRRLSPTASQDLRSFASAARVTMNTVVLGAWARLLATYADDPAPLFGTTVTTRPHDMADIEAAVGVYINTLPLVVPLKDQPLAEWLQAIQSEQQAMQDFALSSLTEIQRHSSVPSGTPLFESIVVFENHGSAEDAFEKALHGSTLQARLTDFVDQSNFPIALLAIPDAELSFELVYDQSRFSTEFAKGLLTSLEYVLCSFVAHPNRAVTDHSIAPAPQPIRDRAQALPPPLHHQITSRSAPDAALRAQGHTMSYGDLDRASDRIAGALVTEGVSAGDFVGLLSPRSPDFVAGMLGILKSGAAFVPLDPDYPPAHNRAAVDGTGLDVIVTTESLRSSAAEIARKVIVSSGSSHAPPIVEPDIQSPAYIIHTSGSQGQRKGVVVSHGNIAFSTAARAPVYGGGPARFLLLSPVAFDSAMVGLFWTLSTGGTLVLPESGQERDISAIADLIEKEAVTHLLCIPSLYRLLLEFAPSDLLKTLDTVIVAGEACPPDVVAEHFRTLSGVRLFNEYGPTEVSVWCLAAELTAADADRTPVPIGRSIPGMSAHLFDRWDHPVPDLVAGELAISGPGVAQGYLGLAEATAERFRTDPFDATRRMYRTGDMALRGCDGRHVFLGRADDQIKVNGFRIEPGEIAGVMSTHPDIAEAHVMLHRIPEGHSLDDLRALLTAFPAETVSLMLDDILADAEHDRTEAQRTT